MMIENNYVTELSLKLDILQLLEIASVCKKTTEKLHQRTVNDVPYLKIIKEQFKILSPTYNIYKFSPYGFLPPHIDVGRNATLNIPIVGTEQSVTKFFKHLDTKATFDKRRMIRVFETPLKETFRFTLSKASLINTAVPHSVENGIEQRIIISWSIIDGVSYEESRDYFKSKLGS